jgi:hypothetical protein
MPTHVDDTQVTPPLPSTRIPSLVILVLLAGIILLYLWGLRSPDRLLGGPPEKIEYLRHMAPAKQPSGVKPVAQPVTPSAPPSPAPAVTVPHAPAVPAETPKRVVGE